MTSRLLPLLLAASMLLGACSSQTDAPDPDAATATAETAAPAAGSGETAPATSTTAAGDTGTAATSEAKAEAGPNTNPVVPPAGPAPVAGTDYVEIAGGQPYAPAMGKIEVVEVFGYTCPHCAHFEPLFESWTAKQPADVKVVALAAPFGGYWEPYARAFYAAEALGVLEQSHAAMFNAIHVDRSMPAPPTVASNDQIAAFYTKHGVDPKKFASTMDSFAVNAKLKRVGQFLARSGVESTPDLIVNGKYRVIGGNSFEDRLRITDHLVAMERAAMATAPAAPAAEGAE
ncbi:thiol:disulfide interchange protein DsbA/DsbL [Marilutibacter aestuarii]|uniref:Thiol:disulfide interchange protein DsbA/DsbL n=1 Tax=Marilutibacter aestuarii TaxID=1706195 RepID=A0A508AMZ4_9GAMM|nr:thiol:disulfide interchange protein DsbA/DsbL [Lysobacter aestuarii]TQD50847.1 thiol:disulfide interchange protein DsbA/DsbL [Lysobacter aestuarii]